jgi:hypothetical protein
VTTTQKAHAFFSRPIGRLIAHFFESASLFLALFSFGWLMSVVLSCLNRIHPFPEHVLKMIGWVELSLIYFDVVCSVVVLLIGTWRFGMRLLGVER